MAKKFAVMLTESQIDAVQSALACYSEDCIGESGTHAEKRTIARIVTQTGIAKGQALAWRKAKP